MTRKIFTYAFMLGAAIMLICTVIFFTLQYSQTMEESYEALQGEASYAASGLQVGGIDYLKSLENINRITWIGHDGAVYYDSEHPGLKVNQGQFREVQEALKDGTGQGIRQSSSEKVQTMYYAFLCKDGTILRLSRPVSAITYAFQAITPLFGVIVLVLLFSGVVAFRIANMISEPINRMNLDDLQHDEVYPELFPLVDRLKEQRETIERETDERERLRREFSANVSHELKTPLTSISGFAELMRSGICSEEKMVEFAGDIYGESQRMIALINDIIRISELDEGAVSETLEEVDLFKAAGDAVQSLRNIAQTRGISITLEEPERDEPVKVSGSAHLIREMIYNLCDNAVKYNVDGGDVFIRVWDDGGNSCFYVEDTGIGIPEAEQERVFERFYRVDKSHSRKIGGTGLGLSIVKHAAQFHDAAIEMDSETGRGTKITLRFPHNREDISEKTEQEKAS